MIDKGCPYSGRVQFSTNGGVTPYSPVFFAALFRKRLASRTYRRSTATDLCPVCSWMDCSVAPPMVACVMSPARSECAPNDAGFFPIVAAHFFTTRQMTLSESRVGNGLFHRFTPRKSGPDVTCASSIHARTALTGQVRGSWPYGIPIFRPAQTDPSLSAVSALRNLLRRVEDPQGPAPQFRFGACRRRSQEAISPCRGRRRGLEATL